MKYDLKDSLKLCLVVLSKYLVMASMSSWFPYTDLRSFSTEPWLKREFLWSKRINLLRKFGLGEWRRTRPEVDLGWSKYYASAVVELTFWWRNFSELAIRGSRICTDVDRPTTTVNNKIPVILLSGRQSRKIYIAERLTGLVKADGISLRQKWRLASPSVTKLIRRIASDSFITKPALTAAWRISDCCFPSQPFGCVSMKSMLLPTERSISSPCRCCIYCFVARYKYLNRSPKISITVLFNGRGGISLSSSPCSATRWDGRRCNLNLKANLDIRCALDKRFGVPFGPNETFDLQQLRIYICVSFRADSNDISISIVTNDTWYFRIARYFLLARESEMN